MTSIDSFGGGTWIDPLRSLARGWFVRMVRRGAASLARVIGLVALLGVGLAVASSLVPDRPRVPFPAETWSKINRPIPVFGLTGTDFARLPLDYEAARQASGSGRRDMLTFGDPQGEGAWLRLTFSRTGLEPASGSDLTRTLADLGRDAGLDLSAIGEVGTIATRFGPFDVADLRIGTASGPAPCLGFGGVQAEGAPLRIAGFMCGTAERPAGRNLLGCMIDRIDLLAAGDDQSLRDLFVAAERRRGSACQPAALTQAGSRTTWLDANASAPRLRELSSAPGRVGRR